MKGTIYITLSPKNASVVKLLACAIRVR